MSAIMDQAFGQSTSDEEWDRLKDKWPYNPNAPKPEYEGDLDPVLKELRNKKLLKEKMKTKELITEAIEIPPNASTDDVAKSYADSLNKKLADKLLKIANGEKVIPLTEEEKKFLIVQSKNNDEIEIETSKEFVIKKGNKAIVVNPETLNVSVDKKISDVVRTKSIEYGLNNMEDESKITRTVNKNAYEIRSDVLEMSLDFLKWRSEMENKNIEGISGSIKELPHTDDVMDTAKKFYSFVENRRMYE